MRSGRIHAVIVAVGLLAFCGAALYAGHLLTKPSRLAAGPSPPELGAVSVSFLSGSGKTVKGWFSQGRAGSGSVLLLHGIRANRVAMLGRAKFLRALGYSVLLVDLQAHGESEGERVTFGYMEGKDATASVAKLKELALGERVGALGVSLGAASLVLSDAHAGLNAIVLESMYPSITEAIDDRLRLHLGEWGTLLAPALLWQLEPRLGVSTDDLRPIERMRLLKSPVLLVHGTKDLHTTFAEAERVFGAIRAPKELYSVMGAAHVDLHRFAGMEYERRISRFFEIHLREYR